ncbi:hypothetical protein NL676_028634 [Syzygium grande]|nr:hypothetical protein NL676_028634 [Syzygium grande]
MLLKHSLQATSIGEWSNGYTTILVAIFNETSVRLLSNHEKMGAFSSSLYFCLTFPSKEFSPSLPPHGPSSNAELQAQARLREENMMLAWGQLYHSANLVNVPYEEMSYCYLLVEVESQQQHKVYGS